MPRFPRPAPRMGWVAAVAAALVVALAFTGGVEAAFQDTTDNTGNSLGAAATFPRYAQTVAGDSPSVYYRLNERPAGGLAADARGGAPGTYGSPYGFGVSGATGDGNHALELRTGTGTDPDVHSDWVSDPQDFTEEVWFRTTTTSGGKIMGFGTYPSGDSNGYDRHIYMLDDGTLDFGVCCPAAGGNPYVLTSTSTAAAYNDGQWHMAAASVGPGGMEFYVDGALVASDPSVTEGQHFDGYWRVGGDNLGSGWPDPPSSYYFDGDVDEVAVYPTQLAGTSIHAHYVAAGSGYSAAVLSDNPSLYWRFDDAPGTVAADASGNNHPGQIDRGPWPGPTAVAGATSDGDGAAHFTGDGSITTSTARPGPDTFSLELWFRTTTSSGGRLIGFGDHQDQESANYDRQVYLGDDGTVYFGVNPDPGGVILSSGAGYNNGAWHHVVATDGSDGIRLYVDGVQVDQNGTGGGQNFTGYWRVGGDNLNGWPGEPGTHFFTGDIDEVAVYSTELTSGRVSAHHTAASGGSYSAAVLADSPDLYWRLDAHLDQGITDVSGHGDDGVPVGRFVPFGATSGPMRAGQPATIAAHFTGASNLASAPATAPPIYTLEFWFRTRTTTGGKILGFGLSPYGQSLAYDHHVYMRDDGHLVFGNCDSNSCTHTVATSASYNDGQWHYVAASVGAAGAKLYVDGKVDASDPSLTVADTWDGYWRVGGDNLGAWPDQPSSDYFTGDVAEVAVYAVQLSDDQVRIHAYANH